MRAYIGLGSNLGDRAGNIKKAVQLLEKSPGIKVVKLSPFYETEPVGDVPQGKFINAAAEVYTALFPLGLLALCRGIEDALGRVRTVKWGPRTIDLDILLYDEEVIETGELAVPHPLMHEREFVLKPLSDIAPDAYHPVLRKTVLELLEGLEPPPTPGPSPASKEGEKA
ncbi:MAG: 2-amino-4-hydroxy-6-hydroxymethyldihydropteridine diphosphokinase [Nitrospirota bacterium]